MNTDILDPRLLDQLRRHFTATVAIQTGTPTTTASGANTTAWANVVGLEALDAMVAMASAEETRQPGGVFATVTHTIMLLGRHAVTPGQRAVVTGTNINDGTYDIDGAVGDSQGLYTRLMVRKVA